jgi:hypothetical protein
MTPSVNLLPAFIWEGETSRVAACRLNVIRSKKIFRKSKRLKRVKFVIMGEVLLNNKLID